MLATAVPMTSSKDEKAVSDQLGAVFCNLWHCSTPVAVH